MKADLTINIVLSIDIILLVLALLLRKITWIQALVFVGFGLLPVLIGIVVTLVLMVDDSHALIAGLIITYVITILTLVLIGIILLFYVLKGKTLPPKKKWLN